MSLKNNSIANFAGQAYTSLIGIVMLPFYLELLGAEAYGLVGFFVLLQSWLSLMTAGMAPTLARQVAHFRGRGQLADRPFREMLRSFELIVLPLACVTTMVVWPTSEWIANHWLTIKHLDVSDVAYCIKLMGVMAGLRWGVALYSSGINGLEKQVWFNGFNIIFATLRYGLAYALLRWLSRDVTHFFEFQLLIGLIELLLICRKFYASQPKGGRQNDPGLVFSWTAIRPVLPFIASITYTSMLWIFTTQSDKLILSHTLPLAEFGYFAVVAVIANALLRFSEPINQAALPRLVILHSQGNESAMLGLYRIVTQYLAIIVFCVAGIVSMFSQPVLYAITGNHEAAEWGAPVLLWFVLGNCILVIAGMQYTLQFAHGQLRLHVINSSISAAIQVPLLAYFAYYHGAVAVAMAWFFIRLATFFIWPPIVHRKFAPGLHWKWLRHDILMPFVRSTTGLLIINFIVNRKPNLLHTDSRIQIFGVLLILTISLVSLVALSSRSIRKNIITTIRGKIKPPESVISHPCSG